MSSGRKKGPGKAYRKGLSLIEAVQRFSDDTEAERWFVQRRWPHGITCPYCNGTRITPKKSTRKTPSYRCNPCKRDFTVKTDTIMHDSKLPLSTWALAYYLVSTHLKGVSSMKMYRDLNVTQKTAWHLAHRIRETWDDQTVLDSPVEVDETYIGGKEKNKHASQKPKKLRGTTGKQAVIGMKSRAGQIKAKPIAGTDRYTLWHEIEQNIEKGSTLYTDDHGAYRGLDMSDYEHKVVNHSAKQYVDGMAHTNGIESFWAMLKRGYHGTYHKMSEQHLHRYVTEFAGRHNIRSLDTIEQMDILASRIEGKRLPYKELTAK